MVVVVVSLMTLVDIAVYLEFNGKIAMFDVQTSNDVANDTGGHGRAF